RPFSVSDKGALYGGGSTVRGGDQGSQVRSGRLVDTRGYSYLKAPAIGTRGAPAASMALDLRLAFPALLRNPGFTIVAVLTLALGIGVNTANFCIMHSLVARPLELPALDRLATIQETDAFGMFDNEGLAPRAWLDFREQSRSFEAVSA